MDKGLPTGIGLVKFERENDAKKAIEYMDGATFNDKKISVVFKDKEN